MDQAEDYIVTVTVKVQRVNSPGNYAELSRTGRYLALSQLTSTLATAEGLECFAKDLRKNPNS